MARSPKQTSAWNIYLIREKAKYLGKVEAATSKEAIAIAQRRSKASAESRRSA